MLLHDLHTHTYCFVSLYSECKVFCSQIEDSDLGAYCQPVSVRHQQQQIYVTLADEFSQQLILLSADRGQKTLSAFAISL
jgi:hypothetical protein